ncbi:MAG: anti-sigma factor [Candidatus Competibacteraceae bacterium]
MARSLYHDQDLALPTANEPSLSSAPQAGLWNDPAFWRTWSLLVSGLLLLLLLGFQLGAGIWLSTPLDIIVVIDDGAERPAWLLRADGGRQQLRIHVLRPQEPTPRHNFQLWLLTGKAQPPHALGLLPLRDSATLSLSADNLRLLPKASGFAVSLEPADAAPSAQPTGPFLYQGVIVTGI